MNEYAVKIYNTVPQIIDQDFFFPSQQNITLQLKALVRMGSPGSQCWVRHEHSFWLQASPSHPLLQEGLCRGYGEPFSPGLLSPIPGLAG